MSQEFESDFEEIGCRRSGKKYKVDFISSFCENNLDSTREQSQTNRERTAGGIPYHPYTPQKPTGTQNNSAGTPSSSSHTVHTTSTPQKPTGTQNNSVLENVVGLHHPWSQS